MKLADLAAPFPEDMVHWRAQTVTKDGTKAMALAYLDARDVQDRLDAVCGPENWQCRYTETASGRVISEIGIRIGEEWVWKADGAGSTDIEGDKGGISDAFKRAAVPWGVGRYLYRMPAPWVPCECSDYNGKKIWRKWKADPWTFVKSDVRTPPPAPESTGAYEDRARDDLPEGATEMQVAIRMAALMKEKLAEYRSEKGLMDWADENRGALAFLKHYANGTHEQVRAYFGECIKAVRENKAA